MSARAYPCPACGIRMPFANLAQHVASARCDTYRAMTHGAHADRKNGPRVHRLAVEYIAALRDAIGARR